MRLLVFLIFVSCAQYPLKGTIRTGQSSFIFQDGSGQYFLKREIKKTKSKLISRVRIYSSRQAQDYLEKTVSVSKYRGSKALPYRSQFNIWLEKKENSILLSVLEKSRSISSKQFIDNKETQITEKFPQTRTACFFTQLTECLLIQNKIPRQKGKPITLSVLWEGHALLPSLYEGVSDVMTTGGDFYFEGKDKTGLKYHLDLDNGQTIIYYLDNNLNLTKMFWIAQGISMIKFTGDNFGY